MDFVIVSIRGSNGSGKTTLLSELHEHYRTDPQIFVTSLERVARDFQGLRRLDGEYDLVITGGMMATLMSPQHWLAIAHEGHSLLLLQLDTPEAVCLERIEQRNAAAGRKPPNWPAMQYNHRRALRTRERLQELGVPVYTIRWQRALEDAIWFIDEKGREQHGSEAGELGSG